MFRHENMYVGKANDFVALIFFFNSGHAVELFLLTQHHNPIGALHR